MGINEGCSACHKAQTGIMKTAPEGGSESILENKCANKYPLLLVIFERGEQNHVAAEGLSLSSALWISVLLRIRHKNLMRVMAICSRAQHCAWHHWKTQMKYNSKDLGCRPHGCVRHSASASPEPTQGPAQHKHSLTRWAGLSTCFKVPVGKTVFWGPGFWNNSPASYHRARMWPLNVAFVLQAWLLGMMASLVISLAKKQSKIRICHRLQKPHGLLPLVIHMTATGGPFSMDPQDVKPCSDSLI